MSRLTASPFGSELPHSDEAKLSGTVVPLSVALSQAGVGARVAREGAARPFVVMSRDLVVRDAIQTSLLGRHLDVVGVNAPASPSELHTSRRQIAQSNASVGLLVAELRDGSMFRDAITIVSAIDLPWVVLTNTRPGPVWGALLDCGVRQVMHAGTKLDDLVTTLRNVAITPPVARVARSSSNVKSYRSWLQTSPSQRRAVQRLAQLSGREMEILAGLAMGSSAKELAAGAGLSDATVRGQIKSLLRKLGCTSQLQATAMYWHCNDWFSRNGCIPNEWSERARPVS